MSEHPIFKARERTGKRPSLGGGAPLEGSYEHLPCVGDVVKERYLVEELIGKGQFGWVFRVKHMWLGRRFAMKVMHPRVANDPQWVERFREEARQTSSLGHDHIVSVTDFDRCKRLGYFFIMEYIDGVTLSSILKKQETPMTPERAIKIIYQSCDALAAMHDVQVVHRDLKPGNIMVCEREGEDFIKLLDFGIASNVFEVSDSRKLYGTPAYMAPEQTRTMKVDGRADQFSLCTILYQLLVGQRPWNIKRWSDASMVARVSQPVRPVSELRAHPLLNPELDAVIARALSIHPQDRWEDMRTFAYALSMATNIPCGNACHGGMTVIAPGLSLNPSSHALGEGSSFVTLMEQDSLAQEEVRVDASEISSIDVSMTSESSAQPGAQPMNEEEREAWSKARVARDLASRALVSMTFRSNSRYMREWEDESSGLSDGTIKLKTPRLYNAGDLIEVRVVLEEEGLVMLLHGEVMAAYKREEEERADAHSQVVQSQEEGPASLRTTGQNRQSSLTRLVRHGVVMRFLPESHARLAAMASELINRSRPEVTTPGQPLDGARDENGSAPIPNVFALMPHSMIHRKRDMSIEDRLTTGEAFLISRLTEPMSVKDLRRLFSSLSFELDEVLLGLVQQGLIQVDEEHQEPARRGLGEESGSFLATSSSAHVMPAGASLGDEPTTGKNVYDTQDPHDTHETLDILPESAQSSLDEETGVQTSENYYMYNQEQVEHVLELVHFFKRTNKDEAAIETLQRAIEGSPTQGEFYHQLALLYARDNYAPRRAMRAIETALELSPHNAEYLRSRAYIRTLYMRYKASSPTS